MPQTIQRFGWRPSLPDHRDLIADTSELKAAREVDPRGDMPKPFDQGNLGSCTGNAVAGALEYDRILDGADPGVLSRLFIYYCERLLEGSLGQGDTGAYGRDGFKAARTYGTPLESEWPYDVARYARKPPKKVWTDAATGKLTKDYRSVPKSQTAMQAALSNSQTIAFGFTVYESFEGPDVAKTGVVPMPGHGEKVLGGHEMLTVGYLASEPHYALVRNSWGTSWGLSGYCLFPWAYLLSALASDHRTIRRPTVS